METNKSLPSDLNVVCPMCTTLIPVSFPEDRYTTIQSSNEALVKRVAELETQIELWKSRAKKLAKLVPDNIMNAFAFVVDDEDTVAMSNTTPEHKSPAKENALKKYPIEPEPVEYSGAGGGTFMEDTNKQLREGYEEGYIDALFNLFGELQKLESENTTLQAEVEVLNKRLAIQNEDYLFDMGELGKKYEHVKAEVEALKADHDEIEKEKAKLFEQLTGVPNPHYATAREQTMVGAFALMQKNSKQSYDELIDWYKTENNELKERSGDLQTFLKLRIKFHKDQVDLLRGALTKCGEWAGENTVIEDIVEIALAKTEPTPEGKDKQL